MAQYLLVLNQEQVILGPFDWKQRYLQSEFDDLYDNGDISFQYQVAPIDTGYINVGEGYEIFPIITPTQPDFDTVFEDPIGPFYTYVSNTASATFSTQDRPIPWIQDTVKQTAAAIRYTKESAGLSVNTSVGLINVATDRTSRLQYTNLMVSMGSNTINFKATTGFFTLSNTDMELIVSTIHDFVQTQFNWEKGINDQITDATSVDELKTIYTSLFPVSNTANNGIINA